jgi:hypothetical protein
LISFDLCNLYFTLSIRHVLFILPTTSSLLSYSETIIYFFIAIYFIVAFIPYLNSVLHRLIDKERKTPK